MFSVLCHNSKDDTYSVIDWEDTQVDRLSSQEFWECTHSLSGSIKEVKSCDRGYQVTTLSLYDSEHSCKSLPNNILLLGQVAKYSEKESNLRVSLYDKKSGTLRNLLLSVNFNTKDNLKVRKVGYRMLSPEHFLLFLILNSGGEDVSNYLYVLNRECSVIYTSGVMPYGIKGTVDLDNKEVIVNGNTVYTWR